MRGFKFIIICLLAFMLSACSQGEVSNPDGSSDDAGDAGAELDADAGLDADGGEPADPGLPDGHDSGDLADFDDGQAGDPGDPNDQIHVSKSGQDSPTCGPVASACLTIKHGISRATSGQMVMVHSGLYEENWISLKSGVRLVSADGPLTAKIYSGGYSAVRFDGVDNSGIDGFEIYADLDQGPQAVDGLIRVLDSSSIEIENCLAHDAPQDGDLVKVSGQVDGLLLSNLVLYNPAQRGGSNPCGAGPWYQENIDIYGSGAGIGDPPPVRNVVVRGCWLFHVAQQGDWLIYSKINTENILYENNIFGPSGGGGCGNPAVGIGTGEVGIPDPDAFVVRHAIVRNNVFAGCRGDAALAIMNSDDSWVYNNTFFDNSGPTIRAVIEFRGNGHEVGAVQVFNNIFYNNHPEKDGAVFYWNRNNAPTAFFHDHNLYYDNITGSDLAYTGEANSLYDINPGLSAAAIPGISNPSIERIAELAQNFCHPPGTAPVAQGLDAVARPGHPDFWPGITDLQADILGKPRPPPSWDLGVCQSGP